MKKKKESITPFDELEGKCIYEIEDTRRKLYELFEEYDFLINNIEKK
jgi:hypothetical protein